MAIGSMALTSFCSPQRTLVYKSSLVIKPTTKTNILNFGQLFKKSPIRLIVRSSLGDDEVFENGPEGIICYVDDSGEIICEGYDEGPRFHHQLSRTTHNTRNSDFINLLQQRLLLIANGYESNNGGIDGANALVQDDHLKWNGCD